MNEYAQTDPRFGFERLTMRRGALEFSAYAKGEAGRPVALLLHGFPDAAWSFRYQLDGLAEAGFRAVAPMLRGYEPSSQPEDQDYSHAALGEDVVAWIDALGAEKAHLIGHDWGAAIAYGVGASAPERLHSLTVMAVPPVWRFMASSLRVPRQFLKSWYMFYFQLRGISDAGVERNDWALIRRLWRDWSPGYALSDAEWSALRETFAAPGVTQAMLSYYRQNASPTEFLGLRSRGASRRRIVPVRALGVTGAQDGCIDARLFDLAFRQEDFPAGYRIERFEDAGHFAHLEKPRETTELLLDWMRRG